MIVKLLLALVPVGLILIGSEILWRKKVLKGERARKFIHILAGIWMAFWPFYIPFDGIIILGFASLTLLIYSRVTKLFHAIYAVDRKTYGDILYSVGIILTAYFAGADWIFTVAVLLLALADGGAAVFGRLFGDGNQYFVFGHKHLKKSIAGTLAFMGLAFFCVAVGWFAGGKDIISENIFTAFFVLPVISAILENFTPYGLDNVITPMFATILLNSLL